MLCPNCKTSVEYIAGECEFCPECGIDLAAAAAPEPQPSATADAGSREQAVRNSFAELDWQNILKSSQPAAAASSAPGNCGRGFASGRFGGGTTGWNLSDRAKNLADYLDEDSGKSVNSECKHLSLEYAHNLFFVSGTQAVLKLRITPLTGELKNIMVFMVSQRSGEDFRRQIPVDEILVKNRPLLLQIPFNPGNCPGNITITFYIGCQVNSEITYYKFAADHVVYDSNQTAVSLGSQIVINQNFQAQHAADIKYSDNLGNAIRDLAAKSRTANELIAELNNRPPEFRMQALTATVWHPEDILVSGELYNTDKLLLEWNGYSIILIGKKRVVFGRDQEKSDLLVRVGGGKLSSREYPNSTVSRRHAELLYCENHVKIFDHSSYGTYINGRKPDSAGIPIPDKALFEFGDIHWNMHMQHCGKRSSRNVCQSCPANEIKSITFTRTDSEKECYILLWQCCELGKLFEQLAGWNVFYRNNAFFIRTPEQDFCYLTPGHEINCNEHLIKVKYFQQY